MIEDIKGKDMVCADCKQERETRYIPVSFVIPFDREVQAHTIQVCAVCSSPDLKNIYVDDSRRVESSFRWKRD